MEQFQHPQPQSQSNPAYGQVFTDTPDIGVLKQQMQDLTQRILMLENKRVNFNTDLIGLFETVTAAPTLKPTSPYEQVKLVNISGTFYLYVYSTNSLSWKRVTIA